LFETWRQAADVQKHNDLGQEISRYIAHNMLMPVVSSRPTIQAARALVQGYV